jgi:hypothetical protein
MVYWWPRIDVAGFFGPIENFAVGFCGKGRTGD